MQRIVFSIIFTPLSFCSQHCHLLLLWCMWMAFHKARRIMLCNSVKSVCWTCMMLGPSDLVTHHTIALSVLLCDVETSPAASLYPEPSTIFCPLTQQPQCRTLFYYFYQGSCCRLPFVNSVFVMPCFFYLCSFHYNVLSPVSDVPYRCNILSPVPDFNSGRA